MSVASCYLVSGEIKRKARRAPCAPSLLMFPARLWRAGVVGSTQSNNVFLHTLHIMSGYHRVMAVLTNSAPDIDTYFSVGHGEFDEEAGFEPLGVIWVWTGGKIHASGVIIPEWMDESDIEERWPSGVPDFGFGIEDNSLIVHDPAASETYKGRYEPETGKLTVSKPYAMSQHRDVPDAIMSELRHTFNNISKIYIS